LTPAFLFQGVPLQSTSPSQVCTLPFTFIWNLLELFSVPLMRRQYAWQTVQDSHTLAAYDVK